jgi:copper chaperone CopZ
MKNLKKITAILFVLIIHSAVANAQFVSVEIKASGLTCSMCSNSIDKALRTILYVKDVKVDLQTTSFTVNFNTDATVQLEDMKNKIEGAGFFVAGMTATYHFNNQKITNDSHLSIEKNDYHFVDVSEQILSGDVAFKLMDKGYMLSKDYKNYKKKSAIPCIKNSTSCSPTAGTKTYHVTL